MPLYKELKELKAQLKQYEDMIPCNNMGKGFRKAAIKSYTNKIAKIEAELLKRKTKNNNELSEK